VVLVTKLDMVMVQGALLFGSCVGSIVTNCTSRVDDQYQHHSRIDERHIASGGDGAECPFGRL
jgi:hypothetical protein